MTLQRLNEWVAKARDLAASDLLLEAGTPMICRVRGELRSMSDAIDGAHLVQTAKELLGNEWPNFIERGSADLSTNVAAVRCRINVFRTVRGIAMAIRLLNSAIADLKAANLHPDLRKLVESRTGLVVISGPTGSGKSTTLAALIGELNAARALNIISLESPIEYLYGNRRSFIRQREIPTHSPSFEQAIVDALRENPDVLVISEMRTPEAMRLTLNAAETGHLVLATMHSATCAEALNRIAMSFSPEIQGSILAQIADCLVGVVCQRLDFLSEYRLRVPRCEVLTASTATKGTIRSGQFSQIPTVIQSGGEQGMWSFDRYQRWIAQKRDWVAPGSDHRIPEGFVAERDVVATPSSSTIPAPKTAATSKEPIEISIDDDGTDLADLAKRL